MTVELDLVGGLFRLTDVTSPDEESYTLHQQGLHIGYYNALREVGHQFTGQSVFEGVSIDNIPETHPGYYWAQTRDGRVLLQGKPGDVTEYVYRVIYGASGYVGLIQSIVHASNEDELFTFWHSPVLEFGKRDIGYVRDVINLEEEWGFREIGLATSAYLYAIENKRNEALDLVSRLHTAYTEAKEFRDALR